jgi:hypothetical protein
MRVADSVSVNESVQVTGDLSVLGSLTCNDSGVLSVAVGGDMRVTGSVTAAALTVTGDLSAGSITPFDVSRYSGLDPPLFNNACYNGYYFQTVQVTGDLTTGSVLGAFRVAARNANISGPLQVKEVCAATFSGNAVKIGGLLSVDHNARAIFSGEAIDIGSLYMDHWSGILTPNATSVTVRGTVQLEPHFFTQCAGQVPGNPMGLPAGNGKNRTQQLMVCNMSATTPAADCVMGGTPKGPLTTDPSWLHAYSALNAWCFKDSAGAALFSSVSCPGGSESACLGYCCTNSSYVHCGGYTDTVCQGRCRALCS